MNKTLQLIGIIFSVAMASCEEGKPEIKILSPVNGQNFASGQTIQVIAKITDSDAIQAESVIVTSGDNDTIFNFEAHEFHGQSHVLSQNFSVPSQGAYKVEIGAYGHSSWNYQSSFFYVN